MRAAKVQASLRIRAVSPEPPLLARTGSESRGTFRQKARSQAPLNGWACAVKFVMTECSKTQIRLTGLIFNVCIYFVLVSKEYLLKYQPSSLLVITIVLLKNSNVCLYHCWFFAMLNNDDVINQNPLWTLYFSFFFAEVLLLLPKKSFNFKHLKCSSREHQQAKVTQVCT